MTLQQPNVVDNLYHHALTRFDQLRLQGKLLYEPSQPEKIQHDGFTFEFRIVPALRQKPILSSDDPGRTKAIGPFVHPDPEFVLTSVGNSHTLELNKFCVLRPSLVLHTNKFVPQTNDLEEIDITAAWDVLKRLIVPQIVLYNCGVEAGSSQGHKHLQIFPRPRPEDFNLFPDTEDLSLDEPSSVLNVPYQHWVIGIPPNAPATEVVARYQQLLKKTREAMSKTSESTAYNVLLVSQWILIIPRTHQARDNATANGAGMMGLVWVHDQQERDDWTRLGMTKHLAYLGIPV
ncbi:hypothetical protein MMC22_001856 [Lobaria immixta]|nr:hypothetical protein [Lobaria immixta]